LLRWTLWLALGLNLIMIGRIAITHEMAVPHFVLRRLEASLASAGLEVQFGQVNLDPGGRFYLRDVRIYSPHFNEPLLTAGAIYVRLEFWPLIVGDIRPQELHVTGAQLFLPAMLSPSGATETEVDGLDVTLTQRDKVWKIDQFAGNFGQLPVTAHGTVPTLSTTPGTTGQGMTALDVLNALLSAAKDLAAYRAPLDYFDAPALNLEIADKPARVLADFTAQGLHFPNDFYLPLLRGAVANELRVRSEFPLLGTREISNRLILEADDIKVSTDGAAKDIRAELTGQLDPKHFKYHPTALHVTAASVDVYGEPIQALDYQTSFLPLPNVRCHAIAWLRGQAVTVDGRADLSKGAGTLNVETEANPELLNFVATKLLKLELDKEVKLTRPLPLRVQAELGAGWKLASIKSDFDARVLNAHGVDLDAASGHIEFAGNQLKASDVILRIGESEARGTYLMDTDSYAYRFLLNGHLRPPAISGWFQDWWPGFWQKFQFRTIPPSANIDVQGRWGSPDESLVYVYVDAPTPTIRTVAFDRVRTLLFIRPEFYSALEFIAERDGGEGRGSFTRSYDNEKDAMRYTTFDVTSNINVHEGARLFGKEGTAIVDPFKFATLPELHLSGRLDGPASGHEHDAINMSVTAHGGVTYYGFPLSDLHFDGRLDNNDLYLDRLDLVFARGKATGKASLTGPQGNRKLGFDYMLKGADLAQAIHELETFQSVNNPDAAKQRKKSAAGFNTKGKLDLAISAEGRFDDFYSFKGQGNAEISGGDLGEINLLGVLSELLRRTIFNATTLRLDTARANFLIDGKKLSFPDLKITGPSAAIQAHGDYDISAKKLDFTAKLEPFAENRGLIKGALDLVLTPVSTVLEVKLTGDLDKPSWAFVIGPTNLLRKLSGTTENNKNNPTSLSDSAASGK
ncbi:MAG TPA: AsmA-like C-terminal region-containing protein, partial [Opitutaceae bacterium]|nr:AsmA-like C-terminal region-containing protein [Opitutaceae bacterium]